MVIVICTQIDRASANLKGIVTLIKSGNCPARMFLCDPSADMAKALGITTSDYAQANLDWIDAVMKVWGWKA